MVDTRRVRYGRANWLLWSAASRVHRTNVPSRGANHFLLGPDARLSDQRPDRRGSCEL